MRRTEIMDVDFDDFTPAEALDKALALIDGERAAYAVTPNPEIAWRCMHDKGFRDTVNGADMVLADGIGIVYAARILSRPLKGRVTGIGLAEALLPRLVERGEGVFLLGARPGVAEEAAARLCERFPGLNIAGTCHGYGESGGWTGLINNSGARVLFVCLGSPAQERWMAENAALLDSVRLMLGLGGVLDVFAGRVRRPPSYIERLGLWWLYRLVHEPYRITRMMCLPAFLFAALMRRIRGSR